MADLSTAPDQEPTDSGGYSIRVVARLSGISADTLRMWERRYGFPAPQRTETNVRLYSPEDVDKLILVSRALKAGYRAGEVIRRDAAAIKQLLASSAHAELEPKGSTPTLQSLLESLLREQPDAMRSELRQAAAVLGARRFVVEVAAPLLDQVGSGWASGRLQVRHEHLMSALLSSTLGLLLSTYEPVPGAPSVLLASLPNEQHSLGLDMVAVYLAVGGVTPRVLGADTPPDQIVEAAHALNVSAVGISISASSSLDATTGHLRWILGELKGDVPVWLGGKQARQLSFTHPRLLLTPDWRDLDQRIADIKRPSA